MSLLNKRRLIHSTALVARFTAPLETQRRALERLQFNSPNATTSLSLILMHVRGAARNLPPKTAARSRAAGSVEVKCTAGVSFSK